MENQSGPNGLNTASDYNMRQAASSLVSAISIAPVGAQSANPLRDASPEVRNLFLTLYALFEKELLPALDLLDKGLVTRLKVPNANLRLMLVRSAQQHNSRNAAYEHVNYYEVRLDSWSCSCPAFTFATFPATKQHSDELRVEMDSAANGNDGLLGGLSCGTDLPVCKHLLACVLVERCEMFAYAVDEREVSAEEIAGWAAGWGD